MTVVALRRPLTDARPLQRCLLLALLLHVWLVLMFGNATGSAAPGQGVWGSLSVKLQGRSGGDASAPPADAAAPARGGRSAAPADRAAGIATLSLPEGFQPVEHQHLSAPDHTEPAPLPPQEPPTAVGRLDAPAEAALAPLAPAPSLRAARPPEALPQVVDLPSAIQRLEAAAVTAAATALPRPADLRVAAPQAAAPSADLPAAVQRLDAPAVTATRLPRATELRTPAPAAGTLPTPTAALPAAVQRLEAAEATVMPAVSPLPRPSELRPASPAATTALPGPQDLPSALRRLETTDATGSKIAPLQALPNARPGPPAPAGAALDELNSSLPAGPAQGDPAASPFNTAKTDAGSRLGPDLPTPPSAAASAPGRAPLNLALPRGDLTSRRSTGLIDLIPPPPERKSRLEQSVEDAANKDCRKAYGGAGLLAVVPLAIDSVRGKGCKW